MTAATVLTTTRPYLADEVATYRWSDAELLTYLSQAERTLFEKLPSARLTTADALLTPIELTATTDSLVASSDYNVPLAAMTAALALSQDSDDRGNAVKAGQLWDMAYSLLGLK